MLELVGMVDKPIQLIDVQAKAFEQEKKDAKEKEIKAFFEGMIGDLKGLVSIEKIWLDRWLNATVSMASVKEDIETSVERISNDIKIIKTLNLNVKI